MCGRLACSLSSENLSKKCAYKNCNLESIEEPKLVQNSCYNYVPSYNISPSGTVCVLADKRHFDLEDLTEYALVPMRWGMIPIWSTDEKKSQFNTHNARIETLMQSKIYKNEFEHGRRCVVVCDGYFEWQTTQKNSSHQPYFFYNEYVSNHDVRISVQNPPMYLAAIFNRIKDTKSPNIRYTCSIITRDSDEMTSWCHHRMPIVLYNFQDVEKWVGMCDGDLNKLLSFLKEYKYDETKSSVIMRYHAVNKRFVNNSKSNDKKCVERMSIKRKTSCTLDNWFKKK